METTISTGVVTKSTQTFSILTKNVDKSQNIVTPNLSALITDLDSNDTKFPSRIDSFPFSFHYEATAENGRYLHCPIPPLARGGL